MLAGARRRIRVWKDRSKRIPAAARTVILATVEAYDTEGKK
jgi:hypothetical protein